MKHALRLASTCGIALLAVAAVPSAAPKDVDAAFQAFWAARSPQDAAKVVGDIAAAGATFDDAWQRLKAGRPYAANVPKGVVKASHKARGREFFYSLDVPNSYDPAK